MASQVHIYSLNLSLNFKPRFENLKPRFKLNLGLKQKVHINSLNQGLKFHLKPVFKNFKPRFERQSAH